VNRQGRNTAILLAAGASTRLGRPKQLLPWNGSTLIGSTINQLAMAGCERIIIVLGAYESEVREHCIAQTDVQLEIVTNVNWRNGQSTSLRMGIECATALDDVETTIVALCDQPLIDTAHYLELITMVSQHGYYMAATDYPEGIGVPACFSVSALKSLSVAGDDTGAKKWLRQQSPHIVARVKCNSAAMDIDTELDYRKILK
jgi:molybdenum cofactor cytidylyltransferase